jgi:hypothetical protein
MLDAFTPDQFSLATLTQSINKQPYKPGFLSRRGLFTEDRTATILIGIEEKDEVLTVVKTRPRGGPRTGRQRERRRLRTFEVPHLPVNDYIRADEIQGVREFGSENQLQGVESVRNARMMSMASDLDLTLEFHRLGAVKGLVLDADGSTLIDLYSEFGVTAQTEVDFDLDNANPVSGALNKKVAQVKRRILNELGGAEPTGIECLCGDDFWDDLINHPDSREFYRRAVANRLADAPVYESFAYGGVMWWNYRGAGSVAVHTDKCHFYPVGVPGLFTTTFAPANYFETVNTLGLPRYAKGVSDDWNTQIDLEAQTNPLNLCTRPRALQQGRRT